MISCKSKTCLHFSISTWFLVNKKHVCTFQIPHDFLLIENMFIRLLWEDCQTSGHEYTTCFLMFVTWALPQPPNSREQRAAPCHIRVWNSFNQIGGYVTILSMTENEWQWLRMTLNLFTLSLIRVQLLHLVHSWFLHSLKIIVTDQVLDPGSHLLSGH